MNNTVKSMLVGLTLGLSINAHSTVIDFIDLTQNAGTGLGESAWTSLNISSGGINLSISGAATTDNDAQQYAYLDWGNAGLGVCKDAGTASRHVDTAYTGSGQNLCAPSSDDNMTVGETLRFVFDHDVEILNFWFNNNHDGGFDAPDMVTIAGNQYSVSTGYAGGANGIGSFLVTAGNYIEVAYYNEQFYMSAMEFRATNVPEPTGLAFVVLAMCGFTWIRKRG